jgi:Uma2 family endonuclease
MSTLAYNEHYTKEDYALWEGEWELIFGQAYSMAPSPMFGHQFVNGKIFRQLDEALDECENCYALFETDVEFSDDTILKPDTMVICFEPEERITKRPEMVFEVISKSTAKRDETIKFDIYEGEGVKYYTLVYTDSKKAKVYKLESGKYVKVGDFSNEKYSFELEKCTINFDFNFIWKK